MRYKKTWSASVIILTLLVAAILIGCANTSGDDVKQFNIKENVTVGRAIWKVVGAEKTKEISGGGGMGAQAEGVFILIQLEVKNEASESFMLTGIEMEVIDEMSKRYAFDSKNNSTYLGSMDKDNLVNQNVKPGETVKGWVIFDVSKDSKGLKLRVHDLDITSEKTALIDLAM